MSRKRVSRGEGEPPIDLAEKQRRWRARQIKRAERGKKFIPYAGATDEHPDPSSPAPVAAEQERRVKMRALAGTLIGHLITGKPLPEPKPPAPPSLADLTPRQRKKRLADIRAAERAAREDIDRRAKEGRQEERAEDQAPAAQRAIVTGLTAPMICAARLASEKAGVPYREPAPAILREPIAELDPQRRAYRAVMVIDQLHQRSPREVPKRLVRAAKRLMKDYQLGVEGAKSGGRAPPVANDPDGPGPLDHQFLAVRHYREAMFALGPTAGNIIAGVVLCNWTVRRLAEHIGSDSAARTMGRVIAALERLHEHYHPPQPSAYEPPPIPALPDGLPWDGLGEPPTERIGRWQAA